MSLMLSAGTRRRFPRASQCMDGKANRLLQTGAVRCKIADPDPTNYQSTGKGPKYRGIG